MLRSWTALATGLIAGAAQQAGAAGRLLLTAAVYWVRLQRAAGRELSFWDRRAQAVCDACLREDAIGKLTQERLNPEAATLFAILSPASKRSGVVAIIVSFQLLYDYLDAVNERPDCLQLGSGLQLHRALLDAVRPPARGDLYAKSPHDDDGGYAQALVSSCQALLCSLPSASRHAAALRKAAVRCGEAQAHNHAVADAGEACLLAWCMRQETPSSYLWWETAAAGISSLAIHALLASSARACSEATDAQRIDAAYFPAVCAISALLDSLADHDRDAHSDNHSFTAHYEGPQHAGMRLSQIANAAMNVRELPDGELHLTIVCGVLAYYLSSSTVGAGFARVAADQLAAICGVRVRSMRAAMRLRRAAAG